MNTETLLTLIIVLYSIVLHEIAHGYVAYLFGDKTAKNSGRLSLNPVSHIDLIGSIIVPAISILLSGGIFGWAKPVPVNPYNISNKRGMLYVSFAGILMNILLAIVSFLFLKYVDSSIFIQNTLFTVLSVNVSLALFNLLPIPPFDGMNILREMGIVSRAQFKFETNIFYFFLVVYLASQFFQYLYNPVMSAIISFL
jgi:Zn-dependent protease